MPVRQPGGLGLERQAGRSHREQGVTCVRDLQLLLRAQLGPGGHPDLPAP